MSDTESMEEKESVSSTKLAPSLVDGMISGILEAFHADYLKALQQCLAMPQMDYTVISSQTTHSFVLPIDFQAPPPVEEPPKVEANWFKTYLRRTKKKLRNVMAVVKPAVEVKIITADHVHDFKLSWDKTNRTCKECGYEEWNLACWTGHGWSPKRPDGLIKARPDLSRAIPSANFIFSEMPNFVRSFDIIPLSILNETINIIGAGAIGSFTALGLVKMGFKDIRVWDPQDVGNENVGTQLYGINHVGGSKIGSLENILKILGPRPEHGLKVTVSKKEYKDQKLSGVVISAVDSMAARKTIWSKQKNNRAIDWVIDARMGAEQALLYTRNPNCKLDIKSYEKTLYEDKEAIQEPCTAAGTAYTALLISGMVCKAVKDVLTSQKKYLYTMHWNIRDNAQTVWSRATDAEGKNVPFDVPKKKVKKKSKGKLPPEESHPWAGKGLRSVAWQTLPALHTEACLAVPFVVEWRGNSHEARATGEITPRKVVINRVENGSYFCTREDLVGWIGGGDFLKDSAVHSDFRLLYKETLIARGMNELEAERLIVTTPAVAVTAVPAPAPLEQGTGEGEWLTLQKAFEEAGGVFPLVVEFKEPYYRAQLDAAVHIQTFVRKENDTWYAEEIIPTKEVCTRDGFTFHNRPGWGSHDAYRVLHAATRHIRMVRGVIKPAAIEKMEKEKEEKGASLIA